MNGQKDEKMLGAVLLLDVNNIDLYISTSIKKCRRY